jgi:hypothetical protein
METLLHLTIQAQTAIKAEAYAVKNNTSISKLVDEYLDKLTTKAKPKRQSFIEKYAVSLKIHTPDVDAAKDAYLKEKYGI